MRLLILVSGLTATALVAWFFWVPVAALDVQITMALDITNPFHHIVLLIFWAFHWFGAIILPMFMTVMTFFFAFVAGRIR